VIGSPLNQFLVHWAIGSEYRRRRAIPNDLPHLMFAMLLRLDETPQPDETPRPARTDISGARPAATSGLIHFARWLQEGIGNISFVREAFPFPKARLA
jgi:hypothetical protein